jgi:hypothetical protein
LINFNIPLDAAFRDRVQHREFDGASAKDQRRGIRSNWRSSTVSFNLDLTPK